MKTLLIDNYDSFTFNLFQYLAEINGELPIVVRNNEMSWPEAACLKIDNIVISPGPGRPEIEKDFGICRQAILESGLPVLGVCLGHQGIGHFFGGKVHGAPRVMHGRLSEVLHEGNGIFHGLPSPLRAVRYHSLVVDSRLPEVLQATAWTPDGVLMGLAHRTRPIWGVQFHPESICTEHGLTLLKNFRDLSALARRRCRSAPAAKPSDTEPAARFALKFRRLSQFADPEAVFARYFADSEGAYWLHSATIRDGMSRFSFMGDASGPLSYIVSYRSSERRLQITRHGEDSVLEESVFDFLEREIERHRCRDAGLPFDFAGGFVGYFGYELKQECGGTPLHHSAQPDAMFIFASRFLAFDHVAREMYLVAVVDAAPAGGAELPEPWLDFMEDSLREIGLPPPLKHGDRQTPVVFRLQQSRAQYLARIEAALREIEAGETYEVCLTNKLVTENLLVDGFTLYRTLQRVNPAPFSAFLKFPGVSIMSSSPERFLHFDRNGRVEAKPIKGTIRRGANQGEDIRLAQHLRSDEKTRSENLMIVDLLRNDLGRVCETGSVSVPKLMEVETYATVHQLVSTIQGRLAAGQSVIDCIKSAFPGGSMTGAPKIRTMEIIDRLEGAARGVYSGSIGYLSVNGTADLNIVIRTIVAAGNQLSIGVGGAVIALSDAEAEFEETMLKAKAIVQAIVIAQRGSMDGAAVRIEGAEAVNEPGLTA
jgi:para-aminobenzoate synthetase